MKYITGKVISFQERTISLECGNVLPADILVNACAALIPATSSHHYVLVWLSLLLQMAELTGLLCFVCSGL